MQIHVKRSVVGREEDFSSETNNGSHFVKPSKPLVRKSKLVIVDLAGSERIHKSGAYYNLYLWVCNFLFSKIILNNILIFIISLWSQSSVCIKFFLSSYIGRK